MAATLSAELPRNLTEWLTLLEQRHPTAIDLGLDRVHQVWQAMGAPRPARRVITVAGTNGKGSTVATLCALAGAFGQRFGSYTTPHLIDYNERIQLQGSPVSDDTLLAAFNVVEKARGDISLTYFEFGTLAAIQVMFDAGLDLAVLEVGLGGRLDAVNIIDADCVVLTPVGLDHQEYLGDNREQIGREKAGVFRAGIPVVLSEPNPPDSVVDIAEALECRILLRGADFEITAERNQARLDVRGRSLQLPLPALPGAHQLDNMAAAVVAWLALEPFAVDQQETLHQGLESVVLAGRMQKVLNQPPTWIDVGHNPLAAAALGNHFAEGRPVCCVLAMLADKDAESVAEHLGPVVSHWYCAGLEGYRGQSAQALAERISGHLPGQKVLCFGTVAEAVEAALREFGDGGSVLVFGSFNTAAEAMLHLRDTARIQLGKEDV